jgi:hypothetical protein
VSDRLQTPGSQRHTHPLFLINCRCMGPIACLQSMEKKRSLKFAGNRSPIPCSSIPFLVIVPTERSGLLFSPPNPFLLWLAEILRQAYHSSMDSDSNHITNIWTYTDKYHKPKRLFFYRKISGKVAWINDFIDVGISKYLLGMTRSSEPITQCTDR